MNKKKCTCISRSVCSSYRDMLALTRCSYSSTQGQIQRFSFVIHITSNLAESDITAEDRRQDVPFNPTLREERNEAAEPGIWQEQSQNMEQNLCWTNVNGFWESGRKRQWQIVQRFVEKETWTRIRAVIKGRRTWKLYPGNRNCEDWKAPTMTAPSETRAKLGLFMPSYLNSAVFLSLSVNRVVLWRLIYLVDTTDHLHK